MPEIEIGFPGLSPGGVIEGVRPVGAVEFWRDCVASGVVDECDWIGAHCYFTNDEELRGAHGHYYRNYVRGDMRIHITEFSNPAPNVPPDVKAQQYIKYVDQLDPIVDSAYAFIASASGGFPHEVWTGTPIAAIVGSRNDNV